MSLKIVAFSDTHEQHKKITIPAGDVLIHCGDFSHNQESMIDFLIWFKNQPHKYKILIAGNNDKTVEIEGYEHFYALCKELNIIYLQDTSVTIEGVKFHGTPWSPIFENYSFMKEDSDLSEKWNLIPEDTQVLITHTPEYGVLDKVEYADISYNAGSKTLGIKLKKLPKLEHHFCGHIHDENGVVENDGFTSHNVASFGNFVEKNYSPRVVSL